jgi:hypothetical protein
MESMQIQYAQLEVRLALKASSCSVDGCANLVASQVETHPFCGIHFAPNALHEIEVRSECLKQKPVLSSSLSSLKRLLTACIDQAQALCEDPQTTPSDQIRLREVLRRAGQLGRNLRRSPRVVASIPVWLRREDRRHTWEEETWTSMVSQHGAGFVCRHSVEINGTVVLCRRDKGIRAEARVVFSRFDEEGRRHIGVEFIDTEDFWDLSKVLASNSIAVPVPA